MEIDNNDFSFGIVEGTEELQTGGDSFLFKSSDDLAPVKEEEPKEGTNLFGDEVPTQGSALFGEEEGEEPAKTPEVPKEEVKPEGEVETPEVSEFENLSKELVELGIFNQDEDEELPQNPEDFLLKWQTELKRGAQTELNQFLGQFGPKHIDAFNNIFIKGLDPEIYYQKSSAIESVQNLDIEDEANQKRIVRAYYRKQGVPEDKIEKKIAKLIDYDDLKDDALTFQELLVKAEQEDLKNETLRTQQEHQAKQQQEINFKSKVQEILLGKAKAKDFSGIPINEKIAASVFDKMTTKKWTLPKTGEQLSDFDVFLMDLKKPENLEKAALVALLAENNFDFSKIKSQAVSKVTNEIFKSVSNKEKVAKRATPTNDNFSL